MTPQDYSFLQGFLKEKSGLVLSNDKQYLIESRLMPIARQAGLETISDLIGKLRSFGERKLQIAVVEAMTTNESFFFRDKTPFDHFVDTIIPHLVQKRQRGRVRIWCAAASTGQEPYSLAMCLKENAAKLGGLSFEIIGTDISQDVLEKAKAGFYSQFEVQRGLPVQLLLKYFTQHGEMWQIAPDIRSMVTYKPFNLLDSFASMGQFDVIFCRNVLIYFDQATKSDIMQRLAKQMPDDGHLLLGAAETVVGLTTSFQSVAGKRGLYAKTRANADGAVGSLQKREASTGGFASRTPSTTTDKPALSPRFSSIPGGRR
ncbi:CheR family methyltransferase [Cohaesibacter celericrescens]|uniref:Chemotaxis protein methyltransferase n=1 Tax=Cohaesibacter celericrescens TaxID=2067669 RepID=A0A2N5XM84_9HYPH|nr:protein-glutamate O-methyltransferase CheR [Cohaesibacter celericrescens]PLW75602.1 chemotaxis protein CheR [Cohaesibacter celericrescens]